MSAAKRTRPRAASSVSMRHPVSTLAAMENPSATTSAVPRASTAPTGDLALVNSDDDGEGHDGSVDGTRDGFAQVGCGTVVLRANRRTCHASRAWQIVDAVRLIALNSSGNGDR